jgi:SAM-dependent methyltransferase
MESEIYEGSHRDVFQLFLQLVDDSEAQTAALLNLTPWKDVTSILSIGGGEGNVEATLLRNSPLSKLWYLDPSSEQCDAFRQHMTKTNLIERVVDIAEATFQDYAVKQKFDRIISMFSWFYIGSDPRWLNKLLDSLSPSGIACIVMPNSESIEADFNQRFSPDKRTTLVSEEIVSALQALDCRVEKHSFTKWLAVEELFVEEQLSEASLAFAAFVALRAIDSFTTEDKRLISELINAKRSENGIPLSWDVIIVERD